MLVNDSSNDTDEEVWVDEVLEAYCGPSVAKLVLLSFLPTNKQ